MIASTKELTQPIAAVTKEVTEEIISDKTIPPLQTSETLDQTDTETDKADDHEHEDQRIASNGTNEFANPGDRAGDKRANVINNSGERTNSRSTRR